MEDFDFYNVSILMKQNVDLEKIIRVYGLKKENISIKQYYEFKIKSLKYICDTHGQSDEWRIDLELYEERDNNR